MSGFPGVGDIKLRRAEEAPGINHDFTVLRDHADVASNEVVDIIENAGFSDRVSTADTFLGRLENDLDPAAKFVLMINDEFRDSEPDRHVAVVAAGMHIAVMLRAEAFLCRNMSGIGGFLDRDAVDIKTHGKRRARAAGVKDTDSPCVALSGFQEFFRNVMITGGLKTGLHVFFGSAENGIRIHDFRPEEDVVPPLLQFFSEIVSGREFSPAGFRPLMKFTALRDELRVIRRKSHFPDLLHRKEKHMELRMNRFRTAFRTASGIPPARSIIGE